MVDNLNARKIPSLQGEKIGYLKPGIYDYQEKIEADGYQWYQIQDFYIAYQEGWENLYPKEQFDQEEEEEVSSPKLIFRCPKSGKYIISLKEGEELYLL